MKPVRCVGDVRDTGTARGRGVFAARALHFGEIVEVSPVTQIHAGYDDLPPELQRIVFNWDVLAGKDGVCAVAHGYGSMYNHANPANVRYQASPDGDSIVFLAAAAIAKDEELTINYNASEGDIASTEDNWFDDVGIVPLP